MPTLHVEVAVEIWRPISIKQGHPAISDFFIGVHHAIVFIVTVRILQHHPITCVIFFLDDTNEVINRFFNNTE